MIEEGPIPGTWYCISPEYLEYSITESLDRLNLESLDIFLLETPEHILVSVHTTQAEVNRRIKKAFDYLEKEVKRGRIQCYGLLSHSMATPIDDSMHISLAEVLKIAPRETNPNFGVISYLSSPVYFEPLLYKLYNDNQLSLSDLAQKNEFIQLLRDPFVGFWQKGGQGFNLRGPPNPEYHYSGQDVEVELSESLEELIKVESEFPSHVKMEKDGTIPPKHELCIGENMKKKTQTGIQTFSIGD